MIWIADLRGVSGDEEKGRSERGALQKQTRSVLKIDAACADRRGAARPSNLRHLSECPFAAYHCRPRLSSYPKPALRK